MTWIESTHECLSVSQRCQLLSLSRSSFYYRPAEVDLNELELMRQIDRVYTAYPFYGRRKITWVLRNAGFRINPKRVGRLMNVMGIHAIYPGPKTRQANPQNKVYPYLLRGLAITRPNQVWATDITYIPMQQGFVYLAAILDWFSRYVVSWALSTSLEVALCLDTLNKALTINTPEYFNSDQGSQYTSHGFRNLHPLASNQGVWGSSPLQRTSLKHVSGASSSRLPLSHPSREICMG